MSRGRHTYKANSYPHTHAREFTRSKLQERTISIAWPRFLINDTPSNIANLWNSCTLCHARPKIRSSKTNVRSSYETARTTWCCRGLYDRSTSCAASHQRCRTKCMICDLCTATHRDKHIFTLHAYSCWEDLKRSAHVRSNAMTTRSVRVLHIQEQTPAKPVWVRSSIFMWSKTGQHTC